MKLLENAGRWNAEFRSWTRAMTHRGRLESDMEAELENHLEELISDLIRAVQPYDPFSMISGALILLAVALAASWIPARRAAGVQPMEALRHE
jgi:ABC-type lipoprotein release transport system permease subunit